MDNILNLIVGQTSAAMNSLFERLTENAPTIAAALIVVIVAWALGKWIAVIGYQSLRRVTENESARLLFKGIIHTAVFLTGVIIALGILDLSKTVTSVLAGVGILGVAVGFAFQSIASNYIAGVSLIFNKIFNDGDLIKVGEYYGRVEKVTLRYTHLRTLEGQLVHIPNKILFDEELTNFTSTGKRRVNLVCGVPYGADLENAKRVIRDAANSLHTDKDLPDPEVYFSEFSDSSITVLIHLWGTFGEERDYLDLRSRLIQMIVQSLRDEGIEVPFPITAIDLDQQEAQKHLKDNH